MLSASDAQLQVQAWATPIPGMTLDELVEHMKEIGNTVLEVDHENNRLLMIDVTQDLTPEQAAALAGTLRDQEVQGA